MLKPLSFLSQRLKFHFEPKGFILMYHRVAETKPDPWSLCVTPRHFDEHLQVLKKFGHPLQLRQLSRCHKNGNFPRRWFAITFDDGYADNFHNAKPRLEHYGIPATFFLTTGNIGSDREFWWDELERVLLKPGKLPKKLRLTINRDDFEWDLGESVQYLRDDAIKHRDWKIEGGNDPSPRHSIYRDLHGLLLSLPMDQRKEVQNNLTNWSKGSLTARASHRTMTYDEVSDLAKTNLIEIGDHTATHVNLSSLPVETQKREIFEGKARLENMLGYKVNSFSYPYGSFSPETVSIVREAGFVCACTVSHGIINKNSDMMLLPRIMIEDMDGEVFTRLLSELFKN